MIDPLDSSYSYIKILIKETFGASKTYLNQLFLLAEPPKEIVPNWTEEKEQEMLDESQNVIKNKEDEDFLNNYLSNPKITEKNKSFIQASANNSNQKLKNSSNAATVTKNFLNHENRELLQKNNIESNFKANNILKYYDKFLNLKAETTQNQLFNEGNSNTNVDPIDVHLFSHNKNYGSKTPISLNMSPKDIMQNEKEISSLKHEISKFNEKFSKMQENIEFLMEKQLEIKNSLDVFKEDIMIKNIQEESIIEKREEIKEKEEENLTNSKIYARFEEFLCRLNEENEKILDENINLKYILEAKVLSVDEKLQRISEKKIQEETFEKVKKKKVKI